MRLSKDGKRSTILTPRLFLLVHRKSGRTVRPSAMRPRADRVIQNQKNLAITDKVFLLYSRNFYLSVFRLS